MATPSKVVGRLHRQIRGADDREPSGSGGFRPKADGLRPNCPEKRLARAGATVPQTDTGGLVEYTKVDERTSVKELGKMAP